ncbi:MAG: DUF2281 domain-containing protein [Planctomycetota bacterium]
MIAIKAHYDGKCLVPDEPLELPPGKPLLVQVEVAPDLPPSEKRVLGLHRGSAWVSPDFDEPLPDEFWMGKE